MKKKHEQPRPEERIAKILENRSNDEVAVIVNRHSSLVSRWRKGNRRPRFEELRDLCLWLGVSADWILGVTDAANRLLVKKPKKLIRVAWVSDLELADSNPAEVEVKDWMPFSPIKIRSLIGEVPGEDQRLLMVDANDVDGAAASLLIDRGCDRRLDHLSGDYVVRFQNQLSVSRVSVQDLLIICCGAHEPFVISCGQGETADQCIVGKVLQVLHENP